MTFEFLVGSGLLIFGLGVVFWAGAMYNRILTISQDVTELKTKFTGLDRIETRVNEHERRIGALESK